jgi:Domain of unknown function (DUF6265)
MRSMPTLLTAAIAGGAALLVPGPASEAPGPDIQTLAWLAGSWSGTDGKTEIEEVWLPPKGGAMLGVHRDVTGGKMTGFEFLRIATRGDVIAYIAMPNGMKPTVFPLKESAEKRVVFENLENDYPQRILYWLEKDGALHARIEGDKNGRQGPMEWTWRQSGAASRPK